MKSKVIRVNGLLIIYEIDGKQYIDDSNFSEIMCLNPGDVVNLTEERFKELGAPLEGEKYDVN